MKPAASLAVLGVAGCSFIGVRGPHEPVREHDEVACTDDRSLPALDTVTDVLLGLVGGVVFAGANAMNNPPSTPQTVAFAGGFVVGAVVARLPWWTSASYGYYEVSRCQHARETRVRPELPPRWYCTSGLGQADRCMREREACEAVRPGCAAATTAACFDDAIAYQTVCTPSPSRCADVREASATAYGTATVTSCVAVE